MVPESQDEVQESQKWGEIKHESTEITDLIIIYKFISEIVIIKSFNGLTLRVAFFCKKKLRIIVLFFPLFLLQIRLLYHFNIASIFDSDFNCTFGLLSRRFLDFLCLFGLLLNSHQLFTTLFLNHW